MYKCLYNCDMYTWLQIVLLAYVYLDTWKDVDELVTLSFYKVIDSMPFYVWISIPYLCWMLLEPSEVVSLSLYPAYLPQISPAFL